MANWSEILAEVQANQNNFDVVRRKYLADLASKTGRNVIAYYSGWLQKPGISVPEFSITDSVMTGFMTAVHGLDRKKGLDLILHTPGGEINATEGLVNYLRYAFDGNIRAIVPHQAMSAGTMIALACKSVCMGMHSSLGPIDPQVGGGIAAHGIIEEFLRVSEAFKANPQEAQAWIPILQRYTPTLVGRCEKAVKMAEEIVGDWLSTGMLAENQEKEKSRKDILDAFGSHAKSLDHARHFNYDRVKSCGVTVERLEDTQELQDAVLSVHHAFVITLTGSAATSIVENHNGACYITQIVLQSQPQAKGV